MEWVAVMVTMIGSREGSAMKKITIAFAAIAASFSIVSCNKEQPIVPEDSTNGPDMIIASTEPATRTALSGNDTDGYNVVWSEGDTFTLDGNTFTLSEGATTTKGKFTGTIPSDGSYTAYYPATYNGTVWPVSQTYQAGMGISFAPMTASVTVSGGIASPAVFENVGGILRITARNDKNVTVKSITVNADELAGPITLDCGDGVELTSNGTDFYVAMPGGRDYIEYNGISIKFTATDKKVCIKTLVSGKTLKIERSKITTASFATEFSETVASILPAGFPAAGQSGTVPPNDAWTSIYGSCYLSSDGSELIFYNASGNPDKEFRINTDKFVSADNGNYIYKYGDVTITFTISSGEVSSIVFKGNQATIWDGTYQASTCIAAGTMITMGNGDRKAVEKLVIGDVIRTFDHINGIVSSSQVCFIMESKKAANAFTLMFEDGIKVTVIEEHGFYDMDEKKYAFINARNAEEYIGHHFFDADKGRELALEGFELLNDCVDAYAIATSSHLNHLSNGILSMCDGTFKYFANLFEYDSLMKYDADKMEEDIETYGLTPLEKVLELEGFTKTDYYDYNLQYLDIAIGKGLISWEWMEALSEYCVANGL